MNSLTRDTFFNGNIVLHQFKNGYRFSIDAVLLAHLAVEQPGSTVFDLGTGCGIIPLILAYRCPERRITGVEIQNDLASIARDNVNANNLADRVRIIKKDMRHLGGGEISSPVDLVVSNPPYRKLGTGRLNEDSQRAVARHELKVDLEALLVTVRRLLKKSGRFCMIYPAIRVVDLFSSMRAVKIEPKFVTMIHSSASSSAKLIAVTGVKDGSPDVTVGPPLSIYQSDGTYTEKVAAMFSQKTYGSSVFITNPDLTLGKK
jgi:tRNA1Val (adenine37-N6)-methyltransferase